MLWQNKSWNSRSKKEKFDIFLLCYFAILLTLSIFFLKNNSIITLFVVFGWIVFIVLLVVERFLIVKMVSNRVIRKFNNYSHKYWLKSEFDNSIIVQYNPPKWVNAAEAWLLLRCYASSIDMFSLLYLRSSKKLINIRTEEREWKECITLCKLSNLPDDAPYYQSRFFNKLFHESDELFLTEFSEIDNYYDTFDLEKYWVSKWWFEDNQLLWVRTPFWWNNIIIYFFVWLFWFFIFWVFVIWIVLWLYIIRRLSQRFHKLKRTKEWDKIAEYLLWFRKFVLSCDEKKFESFLRENPLYYDEILSYAVVFWVETDLLKKLIPILDKDIDPGDWTYWRWSKIGKFKK